MLDELFGKKIQPANGVETLVGFDCPDYFCALREYSLGEVAPDFVFYELKEAREENGRLYGSYPFLKGKFWKIGQSGQGDFWLINSDGCICWYDHDRGELDAGWIVEMGLDFRQLLELAVLIRGYESILDSDENFFDVNENMDRYRRDLEKISPGLFDLYPYRYF